MQILSSTFYLVQVIYIATFLSFDFEHTRGKGISERCRVHKETFENSEVAIKNGQSRKNWHQRVHKTQVQDKENKTPLYANKHK